MTIKFDDDKQDKKLSEIRLQEEEELAKILSGRYGIQYADLSGVSIDTDGLKLVEEERARDAGLAIFGQVNKKLQIGVISPSAERTQAVLKELQERGYSPIVFMVSKRSLERALDRYKDISFATVTRAGALDISSDDIRQMLEKVKTAADVKTLVDEVMGMKKAFRVSRIVEVILAGAIATKASDIHVEPEEDYTRLRYRLDGVLSEIAQFDKETYQLLLSRIKLLSGLKLNIKNAAQDGRFTIIIDARELEVRVSTLPGAYNESIVMRLLDASSLTIPIESLGMETRLLETLKREIEKPNGMILNTGPTGSGKTTTLYAFLARTYNPGVKIITIEDPIEYHLEGIVQTQVDPKKGYTFETGLRASLRQDPDVIMVGEIRDKPTADTAIHASLTGHLVYSTLHTNTAAGTFPRLIDLGINPKILGDAINVAIAQRLVRILCPECRAQTPIPEDKKLLMKMHLDGIMRKVPEVEFKAMPDSFWNAKGCPKCNNLGYKGRIAVFEVILVDKAVSNAIANNANEREIMAAAAPQGILTMAEDGVLKVLRGTTTLEELERVVDLHEDA